MSGEFGGQFSCPVGGCTWDGESKGQLRDHLDFSHGLDETLAARGS